jgi:MSHA biogenesis protein MshI
LSVLARLRNAKADAWCAVVARARSIELARMARGDSGRPVLAAYTSGVVRSEPAETLGHLRRQQQLAGVRITTLLPPGDYQLLTVEAPEVPESERRTAVRWSIRDLIDYPVDSATVDAVPIPAPRGGRARNVFVVAARNEQVLRCMRVFDEAKLPLSCIDVPEFAQRNVAALFEEQGRALALFVPGETGSLLTITSGGELLAVRAGEFTAGQFETAAGEAREALFERLVLELQRTLDNFDRQFGGLPVSRLLLAPFAGSDVLRDHLAGNIDATVAVLDLREAIDLQAVPQLSDPQAQARAIPVIGCALRAERQDDRP